MDGDLLVAGFDCRCDFCMCFFKRFEFLLILDLVLE